MGRDIKCQTTAAWLLVYKVNTDEDWPRPIIQPILPHCMWGAARDAMNTASTALEVVFI